MKRIATLSIAIMCLGATLSPAAPITYQLSASGNNDGARLDWGFFTTNGSVGTNLQLELGTSLLDYRLHMTEGLDSILLTPANSYIAENEIVFDITPTTITIDASPAPTFPRDFFMISHLDSFAKLMIWHEGFPSVEGVAIIADLDGGARGRLSPRPFVVATAVPETSTTILLALACGIEAARFRRRRNK
jgi:hypothetical protein